MSDVDNLPMQDAKKFAQLDFEQIMTLYDYHPWYIHGTKVKSPNIDQITHKLLNFKHDDKPAARKYSVDLFSEAIKNSICPLVHSENNIYCIVPSHKEGKVSVGLLEVITAIFPAFNFTNNHSHLHRMHTIPKLANGGNRSKQQHLNSIKVIDPADVTNKNVFIFDDITSTGNSLLACKELLQKAGANSIVMIAIGQTR